MTKRHFLFLAGASPLLFLYGCIPTTSDIGVLKTQVQALNQSLQTMQRNQDDVQQQLADVTEQLTRTGQNLSDFDYQLKDISVKLDDISSRLGVKSGGYQMPPSELFAQAQSQFDDKQYAQAASGFELYLKAAPQGQNAQEAYLNMALSLLEQKEHQKAAVAAATLLEKYPQSRHTAQARVIYARGILPLNKKEEAQNYLKSVVQDFKDTPFAQEAQKLLEGIK
ncbi:MAG: tetratricopeptide repeat protein [Elusimicrobiota bacterium]|jgi:TolA-binding protein|nr:tetratricopeptide repeat protein [Elusimicrobiota bacterium]